jgi:hypothetical protein
VSAIFRLAKVSLQTLYKYVSLWHPHHQLGVIDQTASVTVQQQAHSEERPNVSDSLVSEVLHPLDKNMKCVAFCADELGSESEFFSPERGAGDELSFPQSSELADGDLHIYIQHLVQRQAWTYEAIRQCIAALFGGKHWDELDGDER